MYSITLTVVCLIQTSAFEAVEITYADKVFHSVTHIVLVFAWFITFYNQLEIKKSKALIYAVLISLTLGIVIEVLQGVLTTTREPDMLDILANVVGALIISIVLKLTFRIKLI